MSAPQINEKFIPLKITLIYISLGGLWILLSDHLLITLVTNHQTFGLLEILKGWLFILITASFLYFLIQRGTRVIIQSQQNLKENLVALKITHQELAATKEILNQQLLDIQTTENNMAKAALQEKEHYHYMFENMMNAVAVYRVVGDAEDFILTNFNRAAETMDNLDRRTLIGRSICNSPSAINNGYLEALTQVWRSGLSQQFPVSIIREQSVVSYRENFITKLPTGEIMLTYEDVTARRRAEEAVWQEKERAQVTLHSIGDAVITTDVYGNIDYLNPVAEDLTGWSNYSAKGKPSQKVFKVISENTAYIADNSVEKCLLYGNIVTPTNYNILIHREGYRYTVEHSAAPIRNRQGVLIGAVLAFHDVTDKKALQQQLSHQAQHDSLTGLPNRLLLTDRLTQALVRGRRKGHIVAVLFLDLDRFRPINDTLGHTIGDSLLQATSQRLANTLREGDTIARHGGDEFAILIPELTQAEDAAIVARKTLDIFSEPFIINDQEIFITTSIGISLYPADGIDCETLVKHADTALSHAKIQGRNNYQFFTTSLNASAYERLSLENSMRKALEREEFIVFYQPQVNLTNGKIVGAEALVRWNHPQKSLISPQQFIPIAEETGLIVPLGEWVLYSACNQFRTWQKEGHPSIRLAVNLSARQFSQPNLVSTVAHILDKTGLDPHLLDLEITESIAMQDVDFTIQILNAFKVMGITLSIDDFGTGFSSLYYLKRFPIDTLKIDKSFVADIDTQLDGGQIVNAIIVLAQNLHLKVIAEGVETTEQYTFLKDKNCDEMQGFLFSKPVPAVEFEKMF